jgi:factor associated with neutral sphingomyelinase activation
VPCFTDRDCGKWYRNGKKGTPKYYDYLLALNSAVGRSFHDLSRYPVFGDCGLTQRPNLDLNKPETFQGSDQPVGALNQERLITLKHDIRGWHEESFYMELINSFQGYVLYYLIPAVCRKQRLPQNGKFDAPDHVSQH